MRRPEQRLIEQAVLAEHQALVQLLEATARAGRQGRRRQVAQNVAQLQERLLASWLTPSLIWVERLEGLNDQAIRDLPRLLLLKVYQDSSHLGQARLVRSLHSKGWPLRELALQFRQTVRWMRDLLKLSTASSAEEWLLDAGLVREYQVRKSRAGHGRQAHK